MQNNLIPRPVEHPCRVLQEAVSGDRCSTTAVPLVIISNTFEAYATFLNRADERMRQALLNSIQVASERALLWKGDRKLVFTSAPVAHLDYLSRLGYGETRCAAPAAPTDCLSLDILREPALLQQIVDYAGPERQVQLIPYATTAEFLGLAEALRTGYGLQVVLPESPAPEPLWLRDYVETKAGFRSLVGRLLPPGTAHLTEGYTARTVEEAAAIAYWFCVRQQPCIVKSNTGFLGIGHSVLNPQQFNSLSQVLDKLRHNPFLQNDLIIIEEWIPSSQHLSPSIEFMVPPVEQGKPMQSPICIQLFGSMGSYTGELISRELRQQPWYETLVSSGMQIACGLQQLGYIGHFDIDSIVSDAGTLHLLEINARRTGGTHVHELATFLLGPNYLNRWVLLSQTSAESGPFTDLNALLEAIADLLFPMNDQHQGIILTHSAALPQRRFGYVVVATTTAAALALQQRLINHLHRHC